MAKKPNPGSELLHHVRFSSNPNLKIRKHGFSLYLSIDDFAHFDYFLNMRMKKQVWRPIIFSWHISVIAKPAIFFQSAISPIRKIKIIHVNSEMKAEKWLFLMVFSYWQNNKNSRSNRCSNIAKNRVFRTF